MTNSKLIAIFEKEYKRLKSGGRSHRLAQLGALDKCYAAIYRDFQDKANDAFRRPVCEHPRSTTHDGIETCDFCGHYL